MSALSFEDVLHLSRLANLKLKKAEAESLKKELSEVLNYFSELQKIPTDDIEPTSQTTGLIDALREDKLNSIATLSADSALSGTEKTHNNYFVVPAVIDKEK